MQSSYTQPSWVYPDRPAAERVSAARSPQRETQHRSTAGLDRCAYLSPDSNTLVIEFCLEVQRRVNCGPWEDREGERGEYFTPSFTSRNFSEARRVEPIHFARCGKNPKFVPKYYSKKLQKYHTFDTGMIANTEIGQKNW